MLEVNGFKAEPGFIGPMGLKEYNGYPITVVADETLNAKEVEAKFKEAETLYKNYQADMVFLTDDQKKKKE